MRSLFTKETFPLSYFSMTKSTKSQQGGLAPSSFRTTAACTSQSREPCVASVYGKGAKVKSVVLPLPTASTIPRVRTYHTKKPSRFVHALSARPLKVHGGRGSNVCADETIKINPISLCSHLDAHHYSNREVRHSLTWHSSKSESALERFEPVAVVML